MHGECAAAVSNLQVPVTWTAASGVPEVPMVVDGTGWYQTVIWTWSTYAVRDEVVRLRALRRTPKLDAFTCACVQVVPQRSPESP